MSKETVCINPVAVDEDRKVPEEMHHVEYERIEYINQVRPFAIDFEITSRCHATCAYCYSSSDSATEVILPTGKVKEIVDEAVEMGIRHITWLGGDVTCHPDWYEIMHYSADRGVRNKMATSGLLSKKEARKICQLDVWKVGIHLDTVDPYAYGILHTNPKTLEARIRGYKNLLEAGYPADRIYGILTISKPMVDRIEETVDWYVDQMGANCICFCQFKDEGFGAGRHDWEPSLSDARRVMEYRAQKLGNDWLRIGASDGGAFYCRSSIAILYDGNVTPCTMFRNDGVAGNLHQESLKAIVEKGRDDLLFNFQVKGHCGEACDNRDICFGCRATALHYLGDVQASDPKCWLNPEAREYYYR